MSNLIPEGRYKAVVHDFGTGASNTKGTPYLRLGLRILEGDCTGRIIDAMLWITDKTMPRVATDLMAIGYDSDEDPLAAFGNAKTLEQVPCAARPVQIVVKHEEFNGRVDARVAYINALSKEAPPATAESRAAWKDAFSKARQGSGRERAPAPQPIEDAPFLPRPIPTPAREASANRGPGLAASEAPEMENFKKTVEQIAEDMSVNFFGYPKAVPCASQGCKNQVHIHFEGANPGLCWACVLRGVAMSRRLPAISAARAWLEQRHQAPTSGGARELARLLRAAEQALAAGSLPWTALDAAHNGICDLRCEHGCEEWPHVSDWTVQAMAIEFLWEEERRLRGLARQQRDAAPEELRKAG